MLPTCSAEKIVRPIHRKSSDNHCKSNGIHTKTISFVFCICICTNYVTCTMILCFLRSEAPARSQATFGLLEPILEECKQDLTITLRGKGGGQGGGETPSIPMTIKNALLSQEEVAGPRGHGRRQTRCRRRPARHGPDST